MALRTFFKTRKNVFLWRKLINSQSNDGISTWGNSKTTYSNLQGRELDTDLGGTISISSGLALVISVHIYWKQKTKKKKSFKAVIVFPSKAVCDFHFAGAFLFSYSHYQAAKTKRRLPIPISPCRLHHQIQIWESCLQHSVQLTCWCCPWAEECV